MQITLCEDNGFLTGGTPTMIVVAVTLDDGRQIKFPYDASKSVSALYEDCRAFGGNAPVVIHEEYKPLLREPTKFIPPAKAPEPEIRTNDIEREDIVICIQVLKRGEDDAAKDPDIRLGAEYRVLKIHKVTVSNEAGESKAHVEYYDVIDDNAPVKRRLAVYPQEIQLLRKHTPGPAQELKYEMIHACGFCKTANALVLDNVKDKYVGICTKCGKDIEADRPKQQVSA